MLLCVELMKRENRAEAGVAPGSQQVDWPGSRRSARMGYAIMGRIRIGLGAI